MATKNSKYLDDADENQDPSYLDLIIGWKLLRRNYKPFLGISVFTFIASTIINIFFLVFYIMIEEARGNQAIFDSGVPFIVMLLLLITQLIFIMAFSNSSFGLSYDIISSGDMFAEFRGAFSYFKSFWWQYTLISLVSGAVQLIIIFPEQIFGSISPWIEFVLYFTISLVSIIVSSLFIFMFPSITAQGNFKRAFQENLAIFRQNPHRVVKTLFLFNLICVLPLLFISGFFLIFLEYAEITYVWLLLSIGFIAMVISTTVVGGMRSLILTRIYNEYANDQKKKRENTKDNSSKEEIQKKPDIKLDSIFKK